MAKIQEAREILERMGLPRAQHNEISALTLLVLAGLRPNSAWAQAKRSVLRIHDMMGLMNSVWKRRYAENTRETIRRQVLHQFEQARLVDRNPDAPTLSTNSPRTHYALTSPALSCIQAYGTKRFEQDTRTFKAKHGSLLESYRKHREADLIPISLPDGRDVRLSPGAHNELQRLVIEQFRPRFGRATAVLYLGDTAKKSAHVDTEALGKLGLKLTEHDKLPDLILLDAARKWLYLVEVVTSHGPISPKREAELKKLFAPSRCGLVFVSAFPTVAEFKRHAANISWETEVWIAEHPSHLIHFNGDKFMGPR